ncbi:MAG: ABC transporter permease [Bacteroidetes bacterium]|nr:ABC transporter permease [Bacteroidota bacterium]MBU1115511.1 ABC transporter permease [Bacteroidota bacterium]MBU1799563.1 ABC transporter permease [Bacteroidota bacterium]
MFKNYITITLRNLKKQKGYSFINIFGLAVGVAVCILILLYVRDELNYDKYDKNSDRIFRLCLDAKVGEISAQGATSCAPLAETLIHEIPEVETAVRLRNYGFPVFYYKDKVFSEERVIRADSTLFNVFTIPFLKGNPKTALTQSNGLVITESMAKKYFGDEDPMGKVINSDRSYDYIVTGVIKDIPENSHIHFDFIAALARYRDSRSPIWFQNNWYSYVLLKEGADYQKVNAKLNSALMKYIKPQIEQALLTTWEELEKQGAKYKYYLQPITDIHLKSHFINEYESNGNITNVYIFSIIAFAILCIACFNFMNLSTARYSSRAKEVGIRKTLGSNFNQLVAQFLSESISMTFIAVLVSIILVYLFMPIFNDISGKELSFNLFNNYYAIPSMLLLVLFVGGLAGIYPAFFLASFRPIAVLGSGLKDGVKGKGFRSALVIFQFTISITLIIGTIVVFNQLEFIQNKNLGYEKDQLLIIRKTDDIGRSIVAFKNDLKNNPYVKNVSNSAELLGMNYGDNLYEAHINGKINRQLLKRGFIDYDYLKTYKMEMALGRYYSSEWTVDTVNSIIINEAAVKALGIINPIGFEIIETSTGDNQRNMVWKIVGVVKDFHFESLHQPIQPFVMQLFNRRGFGRYTAVRLSTDNLRESLESIETIWAKYAGNQQFEYTFFDEDFNRLYQSEERTSKLFAGFSLLAIIIGCLGLFGLAAYTAEKKTKEIGIRKVLGASIQSILVLLSKEFIKWIIIANIIAWPIAYYLMNKWLNDFAYRMNISIKVFIFAGTTALLIAFIAVGYQVVKAAVANPVDSLRNE